MSNKTIKATLEQYLYTNITTVTIKAKNTSVYTLNNVPVSSNNLQLYVEPVLIAIDQPRELISSNQPFNFRSFFQIDIYSKTGNGMGDTYDLLDTFETLFREQKIGNVQCYETSQVNSFQLGEWTVTAFRVVCELWA